MPTKKPIHNLAALLLQRFGVATTPRTNGELSSVGTSVVRLVRQTPSRIAFTVVNLSINNIYIGPFGDVATTKGIRLGPQGGGVSILPDEDFNLVSDEWFVIADGAASPLLVLEMLALSHSEEIDVAGEDVTV